MAVQTNNNTFSHRFGNFGNNAANNQQDHQERPKATLWMNFGYETGDETYPFVALPQGIPLDTMDKLPITGNAQFAAFRSAQNDFLDQVLAESADLKPGEDRIYSMEGMPFAFQIRRVRGDLEATPADQNPFRRKVFGN